MALPGTPAAEATRLLKNGLGVASFACFEHFFRERTAELLTTISAAPDLPPFHELPDGLQLAATKGVVEAVRYRSRLRDESLDTASVVTMVQNQAKFVTSTADSSYSFSDWTFGWDSPNVTIASLRSYFDALGCGGLFNYMDKVLKDAGYDAAAAGIAEGANLKLSRVAAWRHEAAHDATLTIDVQILRTRITTYIAVAMAFDYLASLATRLLLDRFSGMGPFLPLSPDDMQVYTLNTVGDQHELRDAHGIAIHTYFSAAQLRQELPERPLPGLGMVVVNDAQRLAVDWLFM